ncbi:deoxyribodipyrimidine photo-lyase [Nostocoides sp. F2B08]|uniref:cryptochrome/photolyase family protein n=1 Tax=Nostocoides sp. F2B08 TaxID=2653936 RepID=UPI0012634E57|nr:deoxyribodipyrimidine photo-lyase [Tetrasphaera sp. F2B08]KAB7741383.1 deoxyribodipyrimidine photo-lyase [Tetrasphaera sp. F2B08]
MTTSVVWLRRDLRLADNPALLAAAKEVGDGADDDEGVCVAVVLDETLLGRSERRAQRYLASLRALDDELDGSLTVLRGRPETALPRLAKELGAGTVHVSRETTPYGRRRDERVEAALDDAGVRLRASGTPYAVGPGTILTGSDTPYKVFTPFSRAWREHGWPRPADRPEARWLRADAGTDLPQPTDGEPDEGAGESVAYEKWTRFLAEDLEGYAEERNRPDLDTTSRMSVHLKYGEIHPRTMLADLVDHDLWGTDDVDRFVTELCWREFYADVLWHRPDSAWGDWNDTLSGMEYADPEDPDVVADIDAWREGRTGFPIVDAGMRQLLEEGWMHNRLRMITASFLVKDLHVWWPVGARHFLSHLQDGDIASNNHGWQWVAGTGTDASPYFRVFNPITQGQRFDPDGEYVRRWVPELAHVPGKAVHEPWKADDGLAEGYPERIVDHAHERERALERYDKARG